MRDSLILSYTRTLSHISVKSYKSSLEFNYLTEDAERLRNASAFP